VLNPAVTTTSVTTVSVTTVDSIADPRLEQFRNLKGQGRRSDGLFVSESEMVLERLVASHVVIRSILVTPARSERLLDSMCTYELAEGQELVQLFIAPQEIVDEVIGYPLHRGVIALAERPVLPSVESLLVDARTVVVMDRVYDPENVGSVFRHSAGFGADAVLLHGPTGDPLYRKTIRTSMGWAVQIPYAQQPTSSLHALHSAGFVTLALTPSRSAEVLGDVLAQYTYETKLALILGSEGPGLDDETMSAATHCVRIPLTDGVDSLNVASTAAIALYALTAAQPARLAQRKR
jgi:tRNA G18 (ribose-2'-O)-methylase SpoU